VGVQLDLSKIMHLEIKGNYMKKQGLIIMLILLSLLLPIFGPDVSISAQALTTLEVYPGESIQQAINSAQPGDKIVVHAGTYYESLIVNKPLALVGEDTLTTIIDGNRTGNVVAITTSNISITGFTVQNSNNTVGSSYAGIRVLGSTCNLSGNHVTRNRIGVFIISQESRISANIITKNGQGLTLYDSSTVIVESNQFSGNTVGISLAFLSTNNIIRRNNVENSSAGGHGIIISSNSFNNSIYDNNLEGNYHGMWLSASPNNWIVGNTITNNTLLGVELADSFNNTFFHNNFINNPKHIVIDESVDTWNDNYPSGGNFWSDYIGIDIDEDGFGDSAYLINANNQDKYPLITPKIWHHNFIPIIWEGVIYQVALSSNSTIFEFLFNQPQMYVSFNLTGQVNTAGFCNVTIPKNFLSDNPWTITVDNEPLSSFTSTDNATHSFLHFTYSHSNVSSVKLQGTIVVEESLSLSVLTLSLIVTIVMIIIHKKEFCS